MAKRKPPKTWQEKLRAEQAKWEKANPKKVKARKTAIQKHIEQVRPLAAAMPEAMRQILHPPPTVLPKIRLAANHYSDAKSPAQWAKAYKLSWKTIRRRIKSGKIRAREVNGKAWKIHVDDLPSGQK